MFSCQNVSISIIVSDTKITLHYDFLEESIFFCFQMNGEVFDMLNYPK